MSDYSSKASTYFAWKLLKSWSFQFSRQDITSSISHSTRLQETCCPITTGMPPSNYTSCLPNSISVNSATHYHSNWYCLCIIGCLILPLETLLSPPNYTSSGSQFHLQSVELFSFSFYVYVLFWNFNDSLCCNVNLFFFFF